MHPYITQSMALVGCGASDTREIAETVDKLPAIYWDTLDAMHNFGTDTDLLPQGQEARKQLRSDNDEETLICFAAYVNAYRSVN